MSRPEDMPAITDQSNKPATFSLAPTTLQEAWEYAEILSRTDMVPKDFRNNPGNVLVAIQMGAELGLPPTQALQNIAVINGRPALWGDAVLALVKGKPDFEYIDEIEDGDVAICKIKRAGQPEVVRTFSQEDAKKASLAGKQGPWTQYPRRMRQMRARSWAVRDCYPDALKGIAVREEAQDIPERNITPASTYEKPTGSRTEQLKGKLAASAQPEAEVEEKKPAPKKKSSKPSSIPSADRMKMMTEAIRVAETEEALKVAAEGAEDLDAEHKTIVRTHFKCRKMQLAGHKVQLEGDVITSQETGKIVS